MHRSSRRESARDPRVRRDARKSGVACGQKYREKKKAPAAEDEDEKTRLNHSRSRSHELRFFIRPRSRRRFSLVSRARPYGLYDAEKRERVVIAVAQTGTSAAAGATSAAAPEETVVPGARGGVQGWPPSARDDGGGHSGHQDRRTRVAGRRTAGNAYGDGNERLGLTVLASGVLSGGGETKRFSEKPLPLSKFM